MAEPAKKDGKKKKKSQGHRQELIREQKKQFPITSINTKTQKKKIKARYFNCNKKSHYANDYTKPP